MKQSNALWEPLLVASLVLLASVCAQSQAIGQDIEEEGKVVTIDGDAVLGDFETEEEIVVEEPAYWIGIQGRSVESAVLRTHLQLAADMGVVVEQVLDDSPAAKAGLRRHDIILRVNGDSVDNMQVLQSQVRAGKDKPLELRIIRLGKQENLVVVPERRPADLQAKVSELRGFDGNPVQGDMMQQLMRQFGNRNIGPGMVFRGGGQEFNFNQMPNGVSVSIQRADDGPAQITVKQGDKTWKIVGDDEESLQQLPDDVRPFVERMLNGQANVEMFGGGGGFDFGNVDFGNIEQEIEKFLPGDLGGLERFRERQRPRFDEREAELKQRMEKLEKRLQELQGRFENEE